MIRYLLILPFAFACTALAQVSYTGSAVYQDFNSLPGTVNNTLNAAWADNSTLPGWYASKATFSVTDGTVGGTAASFDSTSSTANNVGLFSFGTAAATDRAFGSRATSNFAGNDPVLYGIRMVNNTSRTLTKFTVTYTGEQWFKSSVATAHVLLMDYQLGASSLSSGTWPAISSVTFTAPIATGTTATALNGNAAANRTVKAAVVTGVSWAPGQELWVRFRDANESGNEQGLAADDFAFLADDESGLFFNGSTSYVTMGFGAASATAFGAASFTLECRMMRTGAGLTASTGTGGVTAVPLIAKGMSEADGDSRDANYFLGIDNNGKLAADFEQLNATNNGTAYAAGQNFPVTGSTTLQNGVWYHVAATYDSSTALWKLYVNGVEETLSTTLPTFAGVTPRNDSIQGFGIGTALSSTGARAGFFQGFIDEVRVWNVARTSGDILANKDSKVVSGQSGMLARFGLDEAAGTAAGGTKADGSATTAGTLSGTTLPLWANAKTFAANVPPSVTLTSPVAGFSAYEPATVSFAVTALDTDGTVNKVEFFQGSTKVGEDTSSPFTFDWSGVPAGSYSLTAVATDDSGASTTSVAVAVTILPNLPPVISIATPVNNAVFEALATINFTANASDPDGSVAKVEYYNGVSKIGEATAAPWTFVWNNVISGEYFITATATDTFGAQTTSAVIKVVVMNDDNSGPSVALTAPANGASFTGGSTVPLAASASDLDGIITKVQFFDGDTLLGEDSSAPYALDWVTPALTGSYTLTAVATDNDGASSTSSTITITLSPAPPFVYTESFNSMGTAGTALPAGWSMKNGNSGTTNTTWTTTISGTGTNSVAAMVAASGALTANNSPTATNNNGYNAARPGDTADRMVATSPTSVSGVAIQLQLTNTSGASISTLRLGYDIQRFTAGSSLNELPGYWVFYSLDNGTTWVNISGLNPAVTGGAVNIPNTAGLTTVPPTAFSLTAPWASGAGLQLRWVDDNAQESSPDQIFGLDNVFLASAIGTPPLATLTSPAPGGIFFAPATVSLGADASDSDGSIVKVEFYSGVTKVGESTAFPYTFDWFGVPAGTYSLTAIAVDNDGNPGPSSPVSITVNPAPGSGTLTRGPYLQKAGPSRMTIRWRSGQTVAGRVRYGTSAANLNLIADESAGSTEHIVELTGLTPNTTYFYSVGSGFDTLASGTDYKFTTPPVPGTVMNTRIWALGDAGTATAGQISVRDAFYTWTGSRVPNMVLQLGDNAYNSGTDAEFQNAVFNIYPTMMRQTPFWSCLGNHETAQSTSFVDTYPYFNIYSFPTAGECGGVASGTEHYYSWDYGNIHFISLDSMTASRAANGAMAGWLKNDLDSTTATWIICLFHHPPYTKGSHNSDSETELIQMRQNFNPILEAGGVDLVLNGHSHCYERSYLLDGHYGLTGTLTPSMKLDAGSGRPAGTGAYTKPLTGPRDHFGTVYCVTGSAGQISGGSLNHPAHFISLNNLGSLVLDVNGNRLDATFIRENGTTPDTYTIFKQGAADTDRDGIPDEWEIANGLDRRDPADATVDGDGDGLTNLQEFQVGTLPNTSAGTPQVTAITPLPDGSVSLQLSTSAGKVYRIEANNSFPAGAWVTVAGNVAGTGGIVAVPDPGSIGVSNRVYRVTVLP